MKMTSKLRSPEPGFRAYRGNPRRASPPTEVHQQQVLNRLLPRNHILPPHLHWPFATQDHRNENAR
jgi:hypothetical protein